MIFMIRLAREVIYREQELDRIALKIIVSDSPRKSLIPGKTVSRVNAKIVSGEAFCHQVYLRQLYLLYPMTIPWPFMMVFLTTSFLT